MNKFAIMLMFVMALYLMSFTTVVGAEEDKAEVTKVEETQAVEGSEGGSTDAEAPDQAIDKKTTVTPEEDAIATPIEAKDGDAELADDTLMMETTAMPLAAEAEAEVSGGNATGWSVAGAAIGLIAIATVVYLRNKKGKNIS